MDRAKPQISQTLGKSSRLLANAGRIRVVLFGSDIFSAPQLLGGGVVIGEYVCNNKRLNVG